MLKIIVHCTNNDTVRFSCFSDKSEKLINAFNQYLYGHVKNLGSLKKLGDAEIKEMFALVKNRYFGGKPISVENLTEFSELLSLINFGIPAMLLLEDRVKRTTAPSYFCVFSYVGSEKTPTDLLVTRQISGNFNF